MDSVTLLMWALVGLGLYTTYLLYYCAKQRDHIEALENTILGIATGKISVSSYTVGDDEEA